MDPLRDLDVGKRSLHLELAIAAMVVVGFATDLVAPLGVVPWATYVAAVTLSLFSWRTSLPVWLATACGVLLGLGYVWSPSGVESWLALTNRTLGFALLSALAFVGRQHIQSKRALHERNWLSAGLSGLAGKVRGEQGVLELSQNMLHFVAEYTGAQVGALYVMDDDGKLRRRAGYACAHDAPGDGFELGQGLVGQAAADRRLLHLSDLPDDYLQVESGLGQRKPTHVLISPAVTDDTTQAVLELGFLHPVPEGVLELHALISEPMAMAVRSWKYRTRQVRLLEETRHQADELQEQREELRAGNEELEQQTELLQESQRRMQHQQAELEQTNSQLQDYTSLLERQKQALAQAHHDLAEKAAEVARTSQFKSEFLANMSHELRTPLNSLLILAKLLADNQRGNLEQEQVRFAETIYDAGNDLLSLINDILDLSKIEAGKMEFKREPVELPRLVQELVRAFQPVANQKQLRLDAHIDSDVPEQVETDPRHLRQILKNLLSNAFKFTEVGEVCLRVSRAENDSIAFAVRDSGMGIADDKHALIFEAFQQADGSISRKYGGTGLGLSICKSLSTSLGGRIDVDSKPGQGSTFSLVLPSAYAGMPMTAREPGSGASEATATMILDASLQAVSAADEFATAAPTITTDAPLKSGQSAKSPHVALPAPPHPRAARAAGPSPGVNPEDDRLILIPDSRRLLVIEDDPAFASILHDLAHEHGYQCLVASTADEGFALAARYEPTAILLDVRLPDHTGLSVLDRLKRDPVTRHIPVHIISVEDHAQSAMAMGAIGYMLKPVAREELSAALRRIDDRIARTMRRVLVVEDDAVQREGVCKLIANEGVETIPVGTAQDALEQVKAHIFDCMVLDLGLPDRSGFELLEQMTKDADVSFPPIVIYTARLLTHEEEQRLRRYSSSIVVKSVRSPERLLDEVTLFLHQVEAELPPDRQRMLQQARARDAAFEDRRILITEDDVRNIFALSSILEPRGAKLEIARNGREALEILERSQVDLVLMDIMMPEMDGLQAMRAIRAREEWSKLPIIALTAKAMPDDQAKCLEAGASDYIAKPIDVDKLLSLMRVWMPR